MFCRTHMRETTLTGNLTGDWWDTVVDHPKWGQQIPESIWQLIMVTQRETWQWQPFQQHFSSHNSSGQFLKNFASQSSHVSHLGFCQDPNISVEQDVGPSDELVSFNYTQQQNAILLLLVLQSQKGFIAFQPHPSESNCRYCRLC